MLKEVTKKQEEVEVLEVEDLNNKVILYNDDVNTFDFVIECLVDICKHELLQAEQLTLIVHYKGKAVVKVGPLDEMQDVCTALCDRGLSAELQ
ncbi:MAG: ATP-dependent Clp protease adaptor ClpS [Bacteroidia bacterium]